MLDKIIIDGLVFPCFTEDGNTFEIDPYVHTEYFTGLTGRKVSFTFNGQTCVGLMDIKGHTELNGKVSRVRFKVLQEY